MVPLRSCRAAHFPSGDKRSIAAVDPLCPRCLLAERARFCTRLPSEGLMASLQELFEQAVHLSVEAQASLLDQLGAEDALLRTSLERLLNADRKLANAVAKRAATDVGALAMALNGTSLRPGDFVGPYRLLVPIGQGGMGVVFRAERADGSFAQQVAIKIVRREFLDPESLARFESERQVLATLQHPLIASLLTAGELPDGTPFFVMEYVDGQPIDLFCRQRQLSLHERVALLRMVCQAVAAAHRHLIVHRDLKPGNVLVNSAGLPKLLDFGIAKSLKSGADALWTDHTQTANRIFSPRYAAPEQILGQPVSVACDLYSLGVLAFELLADRSPFDIDQASFSAFERQVLETPAPKPSRHLQPTDEAGRKRQQLLQGDLDGIVLKCLRKAPTDRYASVAQLDEDLARWQQGLDVRASGDHLGYRLRVWARRHPVALGVATVTTVGLIVASAILWGQNLTLRAERQRANQALSLFEQAFAGADPMGVNGDQVTARRILDAAREPLTALEASEPRLFASTAGMLGRVDLSLGRPAEAVEMLSRSLQAQALLGAEPASLRDHQLLLVRALINADQLDRAQAVLDQIRTEFDEPSPAWSAMQGRLLAMDGKAAEGAAMIEAGLQAFGDHGPDDEFVTNARYALADAQGQLGDHQASLMTYDQILAWQATLYGASHPQVLRTRLRRVVALRRAVRLEESLQEAKAVSEQVVENFGSESAEASFAYNTLARAFDALGRKAEALQFYRQALVAAEHSQGRDHANTVRIQFNLAYTLALNGHDDLEAERNFREVMQSSVQRKGADSEITTYYRLQFGQFLSARGRSIDAIRLMTEPGFEQGLGNSTPENVTDYERTLSTLVGALGCGDASRYDAEALCEPARQWLQKQQNQ